MDTNAIIEACRIKCWRALTSRYSIQTVEKCIEETQTGAQKRKVEQKIDENALRASLSAVHDISTNQRTEAHKLEKTHSRLDAGERDLWAQAISCNDEWILCGPDKASLMYGICNGYRERLVSLEQILIGIGFRPSVAMHHNYTKQWHEKKLMELAIEAGRFIP